MGLLLPMSSAKEAFADIILHPLWIPLNVISLVGVIMACIGLTGIYIHQFDQSNKVTFFGWLLAQIGLILYACIQYYETFIWYPVAQVNPEMVAADGPLQFANPLVLAGLLISGVFFAAGYIVFGIQTLRSGKYRKVVVLLWFIGAPIFGIGVLYPLRTVGLVLFGFGQIAIGLKQIRSSQSPNQ